MSHDLDSSALGTDAAVRTDAGLVISGLRASAAGNEILRGVDLTVRTGEVHAVMGPNGAGKSTLSHVLMGRPGYEVLSGGVTLDGIDLLDLPTWRRVQVGLFLIMQYPTEVPGVSLTDALSAAFTASDRDPSVVTERLLAEATRIGFDERFLTRALNVDLSGGEKKRNETLQLGVLQPRYAVLDELDSGLDVDALHACAQRIEEASSDGLGVLCITHYSRLLTVLRPDVVHILVRGEIRATGGPELAEQVDETGYAEWIRPGDTVPVPVAKPDPFGDTTFADALPDGTEDPFGPGPFAS